MLYIAGWKNKETAISDTYARDEMTQVEVLGGLREVSQTINKHLLDIDYLTLAASNYPQGRRPMGVLGRYRSAGIFLRVLEVVRAPQKASGLF